MHVLRQCDADKRDGTVPYIYCRTVARPTNWHARCAALASLWPQRRSTFRCLACSYALFALQALARTAPRALHAHWTTRLFRGAAAHDPPSVPKPRSSEPPSLPPAPLDLNHRAPALRGVARDLAS